jgi:hypothetical protein
MNKNNFNKYNNKHIYYPIYIVFIDIIYHTYIAAIILDLSAREFTSAVIIITVAYSLLRIKIILYAFFCIYTNM